MGLNLSILQNYEFRKYAEDFHREAIACIDEDRK